MKKVVALLCVVLLLVAILTGCGSKSAGTTQSGSSTSSSSSSQSSGSSSGGGKTATGPTKLYFYAWTHEDNMKELVAEFNKEFEGQYEVVYVKMADAQTLTINTALASGEQIDVMTQASAFDLRQRVDDGIYLPLNEFIEKMGTTYEELFGPSLERTQNINGNYYSIPYCKNIHMVYFNKRMFDEAGVEYPDPDWTWEDFRAIAKQLTSGTGADKIYGAMADYVAEYWRSIAFQKIGEFYYYNDDFTATRFDDPAMKESLQFWYDIVMNDQTVVPYSEYKALQYDNDVNGMIGLYQGKYAMLFVPVYGCLYLNPSYGEIPEGTDIGMTNVPRPADSSKPITSFYTSTMSIPANVKDKEGAWTLLKFITIDRPELFSGAKAMHPAFEFTDKDAELEFNKIIFNKPGLDMDMCLNVMLSDRDLVCEDNTIVQGQAEINDLIKANITKVFNGEMSVDECLADLKAKGDEYIAKALGK